MLMDDACKDHSHPRGAELPRAPDVSTAAPLPEGAERAGTGAVANVPFAGSTAH